MSALPNTLDELYSGDDLAGLFPGGFINFGYYDGLNIHALSKEDRIQSQKNLYNQVHKAIHTKDGETVLEVGIGHGGGPAWTAESFRLKKIIGVDIFQKHIEIAKKDFKAHLGKYSHLSYEQARAESIPFPDKFFNKIYAIESFQHFTNQQKFLTEAFRLLTEKGMIAISTFFLKREEDVSEVESLLPKIAVIPSDLDKTNHIVTADGLRKELEKAGFTNINIQAIGENVWEGYHHWVGDTEKNWDLGWLEAYKRGLLDYYIISATR